MPTVTKTLLSTSQDGFAVQSTGAFDTCTVGNYFVLASKGSPAFPNGYSAIFIQGITTNKYSDWGVPAGALVTGIRLLSAVGGLIHEGTGSGNVQFWTNEADLGMFPIDSIFSGASTALNLTADDYVRVQIDLNATIDFDPGGDYGYLEISVQQIQIEVTYENPIQPVNDSASVSDIQSVEGSVEQPDSASTSEALSVEGAAPFEEGINLSEVMETSGDVLHPESASVFDEPLIEGIVARTDSPSVSELLTIIDITNGDVQDLSESVNVSEAFEFIGVSFQFDESAGVSELLAMEGVVTVSDGVRMQDSISYQANLVVVPDTYVDEIKDSNFL